MWHRRISALIWDLDGTLVDSYAVSIPCLQQALTENHYPISFEDVRRWVLLSSVRKVFSELEAQSQPVPAMTQRYNELVASRNSLVGPCPHAAETLKTLSEMGISHYIFTHHDSFTQLLLDQCGLSPWITESVNADYGFPRKPAPDGIRYLLDKYQLSPEETFYVGDRHLDIEAAVAAGIGGILYVPADSPVEPTGAEALVIQDLRELIDLTDPVG